MRTAWIVCALIAAGGARARADARLDRALAEQGCAAHDPKCDWLATLSSLERASVVRALTARGFQLDPSPWGKVIGAIRVYNEDVFAEQTPLLRFFNRFHVTTKERAIEVESVIGPGELWDQERVDETARRLRDPLWSSVIATVPVVSSDPSKVDLLIVTRDIWSLRLNTQYSYLRFREQGSDVTQGKLTNLAVTLSENNFLGTRSVLAAGFTMDQGAIAIGPLFIDKNVLGRQYDLRARVDAIFARDPLIEDGEFLREGSQSTFTLTKSLWRLASEWGANVTFSHRYAIDRQFQGFGLRPYCADSEGAEISCAGVSEDQRLPVIYEQRRWNVTASAVRQFGSRIKQQLSIGHTVNSVSPRPLATFPGDDIQRAAFIRDVLPRAELTSAPFVAYSAFTPRFRTLRNISTYDLAEDVRFGPDLDATYTVGLKFLGSDNYFQRLSTSLSYTLPWQRDGFVRGTGAVSVRLQGGDFIDNTASATLRVVSPVYSRTRLISLATVATRWNDTQNSFFAVGADDGLRGFTINEFFGVRLVRAQTELRSIPFPLWVLRFGGVVFYDVGGAADTFGQLRLHHDIGIGFRMLIPQTARDLFRFDLAMPLDTTPQTQGGSLHFSAGFESAF